MTTPYAEEREPSYIYGYVSLVDPETGEKHLIMKQDQVPPVAYGYPDWSVVFYDVDMQERREVEFRAGGMYQVAADPHDPDQIDIGNYMLPRFAYLYYIPLVQDRSETGDPRKIVDLTLEHDVVGRTRTTIRYNPDRWRFHTVEVGPYKFRDPDGSIGGPDAERYQDNVGDWWSAYPLTQREEPFPDLPELGEYTSTG